MNTNILNKFPMQVAFSSRWASCASMFGRLASFVGAVAVIAAVFAPLTSNAASDSAVSSGPELVDWTPGSPWTQKVEQWSKQAARPKDFAPPAFGRDQLNIHGALKRHGNPGSAMAREFPNRLVPQLRDLSSQATMTAATTPTLGLGEQDTPYLEEIAYGLNYDPVKIFDWVLTKVEFVPYHGLVQGAHVTALELRGNDYDQCVLLVSLLKQCGIPSSSISYVQANVNYSAADMAAWLGWDGTTSDLFAILGMPHTISGGVYTVERVMVSLNYNGQTYLLDPAFKHSTRTTPLTVAQLVPSYSASTITSQAGGNTPSDDEVSGMNADAFQNALSSVAANYVTAAAQNYRDRDARAVLGLPVLAEPEISALPTTIPQGYSSIATWGAIPASQSLDLNIQIGSSTNTITYHWCDLADDVFNISFDSSGRASLYRETTLQLTEDGTPSGDFTVYCNRIYPNGTFSTSPITSTPMSRSGRSVLYPSFSSSRGRLTEMSRIQAGMYKANPTADNTLIHTLSMLGMQRAVHQENYVSVSSNMAGRTAMDMGSVWFFHARGSSLSNWWVDGPNVVSTSVLLRSPYPPLTTYWETIWPFASGTEHLCLEEMSNTSASSTVAVFESALRAGYSIFRLTPTNWNSMIGRVNGGVFPQVQTHVLTNGNEAFVTSNYSVPIYGNTSFVCAGAYLPLAPSSNLNSWHSGAWMISNGFNGGGTNAATNAPNLTFNSTMDSVKIQTSLEATLGADPVDLASGAFTYEAPGLNLGNGSDPTSLGYRHYYSTELRMQDTTGLGAGWTHSYDLYVGQRHGSDVDLRTATVAEVAPIVVMTQYMLDTITSAPTAKEIGLRALTAAWATRQYLNSKVTVALGGRRMEFEKLSDGTYTAASSIPATLTQASGAFTLTFRNGNTISFQASDGHATTVTDPYGNSESLTYANGKVSQVKDAYGRTLTFSYGGDGSLSGVTDSAGRTVTYAHNAGSGVTNFTITDPDGGVTTLAMNGDGSGELMSVTDARNRVVIANTYDSMFRVVSQSPLGDSNRATAIGYAPGKTFEKDAAGQYSWTTFDARNRKIGYLNAVGKFSQWTYDGADRTTSYIKPSGAKTSYTYFPSDVIQSVQNPSGKTASNTIDAQNRIITSIDFNGQQTSYTYNDFTNGSNLAVYTNDPLTVTAPGGIVTRYTYDGLGRVSTQQAATYASGQSDVYAYDSYGNLKSITHPEPSSNVDTYSMDALGNLNEFDGRNGDKTTYTYNNRRLRTSVTQWIGSAQYTTQTGYDAVGDVAYTIDASGRRTDQDHDPLGHLLTIKRGPVGSQVTTLTNVYESGRLLVHQSIDGLNNATTYAYDAAQRLTDTIDPLSRDTQQAYDSDGNEYLITSPLGHQTTTLYDGNGWKTAVTDANGKTTDYTYDGNGRMTVLANRLNNPFTWTYDDVNRTVTTKTPREQIGGPDSNSSTIETRNIRGLLSSVAQPSGSTKTFDTYDNEGRILQTTDGVSVTTYTYMPNGMVKTVTDSAHTTTRTYDQMNRLIQYADGEGNTLSYTYYPSGELQQITYPDGVSTVRYDYDSLGRLWHVTDWSNRITTYTYDNAGHVVRIDRPNATYQINDYDAAGQLLHIKDYKSSGAIFVYEELHYDNDGRITSQLLYPKTNTFTLPSDALTYDVDNRIATWNSQSVTFDVNGNMTNGPLPNGTMGTYTYDVRNRLTSANGTSYRYNPDGLRVQISGTGAATFVVDPSAALSKVLSRTKGSATYYVYGLGLLYEVTSGIAKYYHFDHNSNTLALTDSSQNVTDTWMYSSFGSATQTGSTDTPFQFGGALGVQTDANGLNYMRARYYNSRVMRFLSADPIRFDGGSNWYAFASNNPLYNTDPSGLKVAWADGADKPAVLQALGYNMQSPAFAAAWHTIVNAPQTVYVGTIAYAHSALGQTYTAGTYLNNNANQPNMALWFDPKQAGTFNNGVIALPNLTLAHEVSHAAHAVTDYQGYLADQDKKTTELKAGNVEEANAVKFENQVAKELGENEEPYYTPDGTEIVSSTIPAPRK